MVWLLGSTDQKNQDHGPSALPTFLVPPLSPVSVEQHGLLNSFRCPFEIGGTRGLLLF